MVGCYSTCTVSQSGGGTGVGGVVGLLVSGGLTNCYFAGTVSGGARGNGSGGVVGVAGFGGAVSISNTYSTGAVSGSGWVGGVVGGLSKIGSSMTSSYSTGAVSGDNSTGGVVGVSEATLTDCAALNPSVKYASSSFGARVAGIGLSTNNMAFDGILNSDGNTDFFRSESDVTLLTAAEINSDPTLGGRFTASNGWVTQPGSLPGLAYFGTAVVEMPEHLKP